MWSFFIHLPKKMEPIEGSETSAFRTQISGNYPKENTLHKEHGESLKSRHNLRLSPDLGGPILTLTVTISTVHSP